MADCTRLYYDGRLMNEITSTSRFKTMPGIAVSSKLEREIAAEKMAEGWVNNAGYEKALFHVEHGRTAPVVLSKMAEEMLR